MGKRKKTDKSAHEPIKNEDVAKLIRKPLTLPLRCRSCKSIYHYTVTKVFFSEQTNDMVIDDTIICNTCGALDHYEITDDGKMLVFALFLLTIGNPAAVAMDQEETTVVPTRSTSSFGTDMKIEEVIRRYEEDLEKSPDNPELLVGYANALRQIRRREDSVAVFERVISCDPLAVEGHVGLGVIFLRQGKSPEGPCPLHQGIRSHEPGPVLPSQQ